MLGATLDPGVLAALITAAGALVVTTSVGIFGLRNQRIIAAAAKDAAALAKTSATTIGEIKVSVDGRLESALSKIDHLEGVISTLTGTTPPPLVAGHTAGQPLSPEAVLAEAAGKAQDVLDVAKTEAKETLAAAVGVSADTPASVLADAATKTQAVLNEAAEKAKTILAEAAATVTVPALPPPDPT
jgi:hypothetical protein